MNIYTLPTPKSTHYLNRYIKLISYAINNPQPADYNEEHHILPESMSGSNNPGNLVILSARHHYLAHWMLWKAYKSKEMTSAFFAMSNQSNQHQNRERRITSRIYEQLRKEFSQHISESTKELWQNLNYRQKHINTNNTIETKTLRSQKAKELWNNHNYREKQQLARREMWASGRFKRDHSKCGNRGDANVAKRPEVKAKNSGSNHYSNREGYVKPSCIHCGITSTLTNIKRWHNNNCKLAN
jgi:hypothetical protein